MKRFREEVCLYYMGFGLCAKGYHAEQKGCCAGCCHYQAAGSKAVKHSINKAAGQRKEGVG